MCIVTFTGQYKQTFYLMQERYVVILKQLNGDRSSRILVTMWQHRCTKPIIVYHVIMIRYLKQGGTQKPMNWKGMLT
jgi:hypothetical protein